MHAALLVLQLFAMAPLPASPDEALRDSVLDRTKSAPRIAKKGSILGAIARKVLVDLGAAAITGALAPEQNPVRPATLAGVIGQYPSDQKMPFMQVCAVNRFKEHYCTTKLLNGSRTRIDGVKHFVIAVPPGRYIVYAATDDPRAYIQRPGRLYPVDMAYAAGTYLAESGGTTEGIEIVEWTSSELADDSNAPHHSDDSSRRLSNQINKDLSEILGNRNSPPSDIESAVAPTEEPPGPAPCPVVTTTRWLAEATPEELCRCAHPDNKRIFCKD